MSTRDLVKPTISPSLFDDFFRPWNEWFEHEKFINKMVTMPPVNTAENGNYYSVSLAAPGLKKDDINVKVEGNLLTISSEKEENNEVKEEKFNKKEYSYSSFSRSFTLPEDANAEGIEANYEDGVLKIILPRKEEAKITNATKSIVVK